MHSTTHLQNKTNRRYRYAGAAAALLAWQAAALAVNQPLLIPRIELIGSSLFSIAAQEQFLTVLGSTFTRILITILVDSLAAFVLGIAAGLFPPIEELLSPFETTARSIPVMGILLLSLIWFQSEVTPVFVSSLIVLPILYRGVVNGVKNIDPRLTMMSSGFKVPFIRRLTKCYLPYIRPFVSTAYTAALGLLVKVMVTAEVLSQPQRGIGTEFQIARAQLDTPAIFAWSIIVVAAAAGLERLCRFVFKEQHTAAAFKTGAAQPHSSIKGSTGSVAYRDVPAACKVVIDGLCFGFKNNLLFKDFDLTIESGRTVFFLGKSGRGKTTLLYILAGFIPPAFGSIALFPKGEYTHISFAYQDIRLLPHLTAEENIRYVLPEPFNGLHAKETAYRMLNLFGLAGFEHFLPHQLSGGMQRRVSLARALAYPADLMLLDEAFDSLDTDSQQAAADAFFTLAQQEQRTIVCVSHDVSFARRYADIIIEL